MLAPALQPLAPSRPVERMTLRVASTLYDVSCLAALFDMLRSELKGLMLVLAQDVQKNLDTLHQVVDA
jgi:hypothetical protein